MNKIKELTLASMFLALGVILPQIFHFIPNAGNILLPMHIPVLICGFICNPFYSLFVGVLTPILSNLIFSMPPTIMLQQMIVELGVYGLSVSLLNKRIKKKNNIIKNYIVLIFSMIIGRVIYGITNTLFFRGNTYSLLIWLSGAFITCFPGILIQLIIIPFIVYILKKYKF